MADTSHVVRIPRSDEDGSFVLIRVSSSGSGGSGSSGGLLNLKLAATEGVAPYVLELRHSRIDKLRAKNAPCSAEEWELSLTAILLGKAPLENVDATAEVAEESNITITVRRRVENITQRLGSLSLAYDADEGIELFEWCGEAVASRTQIQQELGSATAERDRLEKAVDELRQQLEEFLAAKEEDENTLLQKFSMLLNEKKVKIRVQQRQLAAYAEDVKRKEQDEPTVKEEVQQIKKEEDSPPPSARARRQRATRAKTAKTAMPVKAAKATTNEPTKPTKSVSATAGPASRSAKRPAATALDDESESDDGFEGPATTVDLSGAGGSAAAADEDSTDEDRTTDHDESTDSETEEADDAGTAPATASDPMEQDVDVKEEQVEQPQSVAETVAPPPRRNLTIGQARKPPVVVPPPTGGDSESDDEL